MQPDVRYVKSGGAAIAYQVVGEGETDLVYIPDYVSNLVYGWESRYWRRFYDALAAAFRLILFDKRGTGLSDLGGQFPALETRMEDLHAVLDAVESERAVLLGSHDGCSLSALHAATYPERTHALALFHPSAYGWGLKMDARELERTLAELRDGWGTQEYTDELLADAAPTLLADDNDRLWMANWLRVGATPAVAYALNRAWAETDLRDLLPAVRVPTLVLYRSVEEDNARTVARLIPGARLLHVSGQDYSEIYFSAEIPDEVARFVAGEEAPTIPDTVLATLLFTDIVSSTERAADLGDREWRALLERHHGLVRRELNRFRGEEEGHGRRRLLRDVRRAGAGDPLRRGDPRCRLRARSRRASRRPHRRVRARGRQAVGHRREHRGARHVRRECRGGPRVADGQGPRRGLGDPVRGAWRA
jgi:pimeloyl-ACP methyl ester carboxylesterase